MKFLTASVHATLLLFVPSSLVAASSDGIKRLAVVKPSVSCSSLQTYDLTPSFGTNSTIRSVSTVTISGVEVCKVVGSLPLTVGFTLVLPTQTWTQRYVQLGCGGLCGMSGISGLSINAASKNSLAAAGSFVLGMTDMGHTGGAEFGNIPQKRIDFAYRAQHLMAVVAKRLSLAYYGKEPVYSYFSGCSDGGREALVEAERYPDDFNGIIAGAPAMNFASLNSFYHGWMYLSNTDSNGKAIFLNNKVTVLTNAVLKQCDALDGLTDGVLRDPRLCKFDPASIQCAASAQSTSDCLTAQEVAVVRKFYNGPTDPKTGTHLTVGQPVPGSEKAWGPFVPSTSSGSLSSESHAYDALAYLLYPTNPTNYSIRTNLKFTLKAFNELNPLYCLYCGTDPDLRRFAKRGSKLLLYHGWSDGDISPMNSIAYFQAVERFFGPAATANFLKLYLIPGMHHCGGGEATSAFDLLDKVMAWAEGGVKPNEVITYVEQQRSGGGFGGPPSGGNFSGGTPGRRQLQTSSSSSSSSGFPANASRPVYPYPQVAEYIGTGSVYEASNFRAIRGNTKPNPIQWAGEKYYKPNVLLQCSAGSSLPLHCKPQKKKNRLM